MRQTLWLVLFFIIFILPKGWGQELPLGDNLVVNGDFENGNTGFSSQYTRFTNTLPDPGGCKYCVDVNAASHYGNGSNQPWLGNGNNGQGQYDAHSMFMMASGGSTSLYVWQSTVNVKPHTDYVFDAWICHLYKSFGNTYTAQVKFVINGTELGVLSSPSHRNGYVEFNQTWNSGNATTAVISIYDINTNLDAGNDFGLDDISFRERLVMSPISRITPVCAGSSLELTPPELYCQGCSGQWEILQGGNVIHTSTANTIPNVSISWNGCSLRYAVNYQGVWRYSNEVQIYVTQNLSVNIQVIGGDATLCEDDSVVLHANVANDVMNFDFINVGDILCTDGSIVKPSNWPAAGKTAKGIVFYVDSTDVHGWALGLTEKDYVKWSSSYGNISGLPNISQIREAMRDFDGKGNTQKITAAGNQTAYPAAWYCVSEGGYLPSIGQLNILFKGFAKVNSSLSLVGGVQFVTGTGWLLLSSTVQLSNKAYCIDRAGEIQSADKQTPGGNSAVTRIVRTVYDF